MPEVHREVKRTALPEGALRPDTSAVGFHDSFADIKTEARSAGVQSPDVFAAGKLGFFLAPLKELLSPWVNKSSILRLDKFVF